ncbi:MAG TPA: hypothetical protein VGF60_22780 [Xanthobacteraceae bacterium]
MFGFLSNPFGDTQQARELLSQIGGRSIHDIELQRGEFCFQIAFYFLACLAIAAHVRDPAVQRKCINALYDRVRAFYAGPDATVRFCDVVVAAEERDQFAPALRQLLRSTGGSDHDISRAVVTRLGLFDLIGLRRLYEYHEIIGPEAPSPRFYFVAEQVLLQHSGERHHPIVVAVIADLLSANYDILSRIVLAVLPEMQPDETQPDELDECVLVAAGMPDVTGKQPSKAYAAGKYLLLLLEDLPPQERQRAISFRYALAMCDRRRQWPLCLVTLENSASISNVLCVFEPDGSHSNYGALHGNDALKEFMDRGIGLLRDRFDLGQIEELPCGPSGSWRLQ